MVYAALVLVLFSLQPTLLFESGLSEHAAWRWSSAVFAAVYMVGGITSYFRIFSTRGYRPDATDNVMAAIFLIVLVALALASAGVAGPRIAQVYMAALLTYFVQAAVLFVQLLMSHTAESSTEESTA